MARIPRLRILSPIEEAPAAEAPALDKLYLLNGRIFREDQYDKLVLVNGSILRTTEEPVTGTIIPLIMMHRRFRS